MFARSLSLAALIAAAAVLFGCVPGAVMSAARPVTLGLLLAPLLLPRYLLYYAWTLPLSPTSAVGRWMAQDAARARLAAGSAAAGVLMLWYWPLAALVIAHGWRAIDRDALEAAKLDAPPVRRLLRVTFPLMAPSLALAFVVCFVLVLAEFGAFHLAAVRTVGTELAVVYEQTGSAGAVTRAAWPFGLFGVVAAWACVRRLRRVGERAKTQDVPARVGLSYRLFTAGLWCLTFALPVGLLVAAVRSWTPFANFLSLHLDDLAWSALVSTAAALLALVIAAGALGADHLDLLGRGVGATAKGVVLLAMFLPGSIVAMAILRLATSAAHLVDLRSSWLLVSTGQAVRFAGAAMVLLHFARTSQARELVEMAAVDGAGRFRAWWHVHLPLAWPLAAGAGLLVAMLGMTELSATLVLLPAGLPSFAQRLLNQMHYAREQDVIASCLILVAAWAALAAVVLVLLGLARRARRATRVTAAATLAIGLLAASGCDRGEAGDVRVLAVFGRTGTAAGQFVYPRAIERAPDGTLYVVDKTGRVQHFASDGASLGSFRMPQIEAGKPTGLAVGPDKLLYVADTHYHRVVAFDGTGQIVRKFGRFGEEEGCFIYPTDVAFAPDGRIFVSEYGGNDRISIFSPAGEFLSSFGEPGAGENEFARPSAMVVDAERGSLYVADACNHRIAVYDLSGKLQGYLGAVGRGPGQLRYPYGLALRPNGSLLVCEYGNNRIQAFSPEGESLGVWGTPGRTVGQLAFPWDVAADDDVAYVVDAGNNRVQVWRL